MYDFPRFALVLLFLLAGAEVAPSIAWRPNELVGVHLGTRPWAQLPAGLSWKEVGPWQPVYYSGACMLSGIFLIRTAWILLAKPGVELIDARAPRVVSPNLGRQPLVDSELVGCQ